MVIALVGNQNCGKTTLFNRLTGNRQHVGNWPGVTVEQKRGRLLPRWLQQQASTIEIVDLPGVYSLAPFSQEEEITRRFLLCSKPDVIINVVDATHLERNLYLTLQLLALGKPLVLALNLMDQLHAFGGSVDTNRLSSQLGVPVLPISARNGEGLPALMEAARRCRDTSPPADLLHCGGYVGKTLQELTRTIQGDSALQHMLKTAGFPSGVAAAVFLMETNREKWEQLGIPQEAAAFIPVVQALRALEMRTGVSPAAALAAERYHWLEKVVSECCSCMTRDRLTQRLDKWLLCSCWALPALAAVLVGMFFVAFGTPGQALTDAFTGLLQGAICQLEPLLAQWQVSAGLQSLLMDGLLPGLSSVLSFLPPLILLMFLLNLLEESGYLARVAFLMDSPLRAIGLSGRSLIPFLLGFGCTVPATLSARCLKTRRERTTTMLLLPLMSCGAKLPVYLLLTRVFFPKAQLLVIAALYLLGILTAAVAGMVVKQAGFANSEEPFLLELPAYRLPSLRNALREVWHKGWAFLSRVFSVILLATLAVWLLSRFRFSLQPASQLTDSMLGVLSGWLAPLLRPCGFGHVAAVAALLTGLLAKENIVSTLTVLVSLQSAGFDPTSTLQSVIPTPLSACAFLAFVMLYPPCTAATACIARETGNRRITMAVYAGYLALAWMVSLLIYQVGSLIG